MTSEAYRAWSKASDEFGTIYGIHSGDGIVRYVGQTRRPVSIRFGQHVSVAHRNPTAYSVEFHKWLADSDSAAYIVLEESVPVSELDARESFWVSELSENKLFNSTDGGARSFKITNAEVIESRSGERNYFYGKSFYGESNPFHGKKHSPETVEKLSGGSKKLSTKLSVQDVIEIRERAAAGEIQAQLAREYGVGPMQISRIVNGTRRKLG